MAVAGCSATGSPATRLQLAQSVAASGNLAREDMAAGSFIIASWLRITRNDGTARVYIEGDGLAWISKNKASFDPTPTDPVALMLAAADDAPNVIYLARPCQYSMLNTALLCPRDYWTGKRFAPEVIDAYDDLLDNLARAYNIDGFELIGFSGGAAVAALLAERREDVVTLRTVAGNLDHAAFNRLHRVSPMPQSLNPADKAARLVHLPQHHFLGGRDKIVRPEVLQSFRAAMGPSRCVHQSTIAEAGHNDGWAEHWPALLARPVDCEAR